MLTFMEIRPLVIIERVSRKLPSSLTTYYFERANHHPRDETTEPKNANAETGQHLFFFPSSDTTAALHFFFVKRQDAPFFECMICKMLGKHLPRLPSHACKKH